MRTLTECCEDAEASSTPWRVMLVSPGNAGFDEKAVVVVSTLLARAGISIMYQSTFTTDLLLVPAMETARALTVLEKAGFQVPGEREMSRLLLGFCNHVRHNVRLHASRGVWRAFCDCLCQVFLSDSGIDDEEADYTNPDLHTSPASIRTVDSSDLLRHRVELLGQRLKLIRMRRTGRPATDPVVQHCKALLDLLFLEVTRPKDGGSGPPTGRVVSFTRTDDEISLIIPEHFDSQFRTVRSVQHL